MLYRHALSTCRCLCYALGSLVLSMPLTAQGHAYVPKYAATRAGTTMSLYPFQPWIDNASLHVHLRTQHLIEGQAFCKRIARISGFSYRSANWVGRHPAQLFKKLTLSLGHSKKTANTMSLTWADNRSGPQSVMLQGRYSLPGIVSSKRVGPWGQIKFPFARPYLYIRSQGNLLIDFDIADIPASYYNYALDADIEGGAVSRSGFSGQFANGKFAQVRVNFATKLKPGGQVEVMSFQSYAGLGLFGFSDKRYGQLALPFSLTKLGAANNWLQVSIDMTAALVSRFNGLFWSAILRIPNQARFVGLRIYAQTMQFDRRANALGVVLSNKAEVLIGQAQSPMMQIWGLRSSKKAFMGFMGGGYTWRISTPGGPTTRLDGQFF